MIYGFDYDGTLVESWTATPLPNVRERLAALSADAKTFIATNQAGPVFRAVLGEDTYPTVEDVAERIVGGLRAMEWLPTLLLVAVHPGKDDADWLRAAEEVSIDLRDALIAANIGPCYWAIYSQPRYRKPGPGMLSDAIVFFSARSGDTIYIGDMESDKQAARAAECHYLDAAAWRGGAPL